MRTVDAEWIAELMPFRNAMQAALAEAGYPKAIVGIEWSGVFVVGAPDGVVEKAFEVCRSVGGGQKGKSDG